MSQHVLGRRKKMVVQFCEQTESESDAEKHCNSFFSPDNAPAYRGHTSLASNLKKTLLLEADVTLWLFRKGVHEHLLVFAARGRQNSP